MHALAVPALARHALAVCWLSVCALVVCATAAAAQGSTANERADSLVEPSSASSRSLVHTRELRSQGPLRIAERNPLYQLFLTPMVSGADVLSWGESRILMSNAYSNIFEYNQSPQLRQLFDVERLQTTVVLSYGIAPRFELGLHVAVQHDWGGFLDPLIQGVHTTFGFPNADREKVDNNDYRLHLESGYDPVRTYLDLPSGTAVESPRIVLAWQVAGGPEQRHALALRTTYKAPVGTARATSHRADAAVEVALRRSTERTHLHLSAGAVTINAPARLDALMRGHAWLASLALERSITPGFSLLAQFSGGSAYTRPVGFSEFDHIPVNFGVGAAGQAGSWEWQVSFTEDVPPNSPSVDFTFDLQISRRWSAGADPRARSTDAPPGSS